MANTFDGINRVTIGDPTEKADYDQLLMNANALRAIAGRVMAQGGSDAAMIETTTYAPLPNSYEFQLPARDDMGGLILRVAGFMALGNTVVSGDNVAGRLEMFDGIAWVAVSNSELVFNTNTLTYLQSVNLQPNLSVVETRYRFTARTATSTNFGLGFLHLSLS
jgi:hypothetical protein